MTPETTFETLGKGSMKMIALTSMIENELDAEVPVREVMVMKTIGELIEGCRRYRTSSRCPPRRQGRRWPDQPG